MRLTPHVGIEHSTFAPIVVEVYHLTMPAIALATGHGAVVDEVIDILLRVFLDTCSIGVDDDFFDKRRGIDVPLFDGVGEPYQININSDKAY